MGFYEQISKYYDVIFPTGQQQLKFISDSAGPAPKKILDVACGTGGYSLALAKSGYAMTAVDLDVEMVERAKEKALAEDVMLHADPCDMKSLYDTLVSQKEFQRDQPFDCIFCIGNSLVHLGSLEEIRDVLQQMGKLLRHQGVLLLQIINYDRIIKNEIQGLPTLKDEAEGIEFTRGYRYDAEKEIVHFDTVLQVEKGNQSERYENSIPLIPILKAELCDVLSQAGYTSIECYGDFQKTPYDENAFLLVVKGIITRK